MDDRWAIRLLFDDAKRKLLADHPRSLACPGRQRSDPDEGANIGGGIAGVVVIAASWIAALAFVGRELVGRSRRRRQP